MNATVIPLDRAEKVLKLSPRSFMGLEFARADMRAVFPVGTKPDEVLAPECWAHVASILDRTPGTVDPAKVGAHIHVTTEDLAWEMELTVRAVRKESLDVSVYKKPVFHGPQDDDENESFETRWNVGARGFDIIRKSDRAVVGQAKDFPKKEDAIAWIKAMKG